MHHGTVARVLAQAGLPRIGPPARRSQVELYLPFIYQTLEKFLTLTASRLYAMVCERGYRGSGDHFRHLIACHRPRAAAEAYLRLRSLLGEQGQVDWGHFGHLMIGRARRPLMAFVMVLSYSRQIFCASSSMPAWRTSCVVTSAPSRPGTDVRVYCSTTISRAQCWSAKATPFAFILL